MSKKGDGPQTDHTTISITSHFKTPLCTPPLLEQMPSLRKRHSMKHIVMDAVMLPLSAQTLLL
jgi:hypothetical protein